MEYPNKSSLQIANDLSLDKDFVYKLREKIYYEGIESIDKNKLAQHLYWLQYIACKSISELSDIINDPLVNAKVRMKAINQRYEILNQLVERMISAESKSSHIGEIIGYVYSNDIKKHNVRT
ncbi:hypothetical protein ACFL04_04685 [Patescibacteria group bacterium]